MNHEALNMPSSTDQSTEITKKPEAEHRPVALFQKLGATANTLVRNLKSIKINKNASAEEIIEAKEIKRHNKEMKQLEKEVSRTEKLIKKNEKHVENDTKTREKYPEIFSHPDENAIDELQAEHLEHLGKEDWKSVLQSYNEAYRLSNSAESAAQINKIDTHIVDILCRELGIEDKKPTIKSVDRQDSDEVGGYLDVDNSISLDESFIRKGAQMLAGDSNYSINLWLPIVRIMTISHETWHAFQHNGEIPEERKKMYEINWKSYTKKSENYSSQLVEKEAVRFSENLVIDIIRKLESPQE